MTTKIQKGDCEIIVAHGEFLAKARLIREQYIEVLRVLHGDDFTVSSEQFNSLLNNSNEIIIFVIYERVILSTAQASLSKTPPKHHVYINNVATHSDYHERGLGGMCMEKLLAEIKKQWGSDVIIELTNNPEKGNSGFYKELGFEEKDTAVLCYCE